MKNCFDIIVAMDLNCGIGKNGSLPWHLSADLKHFKDVTTTTRSPSKKNAVIMGRKTWESLPEKFRPLPDRINAVITRNKDLVLPGGVLRGDSLEGILNHLSFPNALIGNPNKDMSGPPTKTFGGDNPTEVEKIFVIGGAQIFTAAIRHPACRKIYVTRILKKFDCDTFFPPLDLSWKQISQSSALHDHSLEYCFSEYVKALPR